MRDLPLDLSEITLTLFTDAPLSEWGAFLQDSFKFMFMGSPSFARTHQCFIVTETLPNLNLASVPVACYR